MNKIFLDSSLWLTILAILTFLAYLLRGLKSLPWKIFARLFICLSCVSALLILLPRAVPVKLTQFIAAVIIIAAAAAFLIDILFTVFLRVKRAVFTGRDITTPLPDYLMEICKAMEVMASRRIGALIVVERQDKLGGYVYGGIPFYAQIKAEVLIALFATASPVHDGAIIVSNGNIKRVKVILPIKTDAELPMGVGTRHRSAVGITEKTDVIALVVSEERGELSIAYQGHLVKANSQEELYQLINTALKGKGLKTK